MTMEKKRSVFLLFFVLAICFVSFIGCSKREKSLNEIELDLRENPNFFNVQDVKINDISIIKRQTDKREGTDIVYLTVLASSETVDYTLSYKLTYDLYNEGWILEDLERYEEGEWIISKVGDERIETDLLSFANFFTKRNLAISGITVSNRSSSYDETEEFVDVVVMAQSDLMQVELNYQLEYYLEADGWTCISSNLMNIDAKPLSGAPQDIVDNAISENFGDNEVELVSRGAFLEDMVDVHIYNVTYKYNFLTEIITYTLYFEFNREKANWEAKGCLADEATIQDWSAIKGIWKYRNTSYGISSATINIIDFSGNRCKASYSYIEKSFRSINDGSKSGEINTDVNFENRTAIVYLVKPEAVFNPNGVFFEIDPNNGVRFFDRYNGYLILESFEANI